ncbi:unnamed protein product [Calypogeia fissa]
MGEKTSSPSASAADWCDVSVKCRCRWRWSNPQTCAKCHDKLYHRTCFLSSTFVFFLCAVLLFGGLAKLIAWLTLAPFKHEPHLQGFGCQPDNEGSWAIGFYRGKSPFELRPVELENLQNDAGAAWPVANPVITCASIKDPENPSNFVADPFLFLKGNDMYVFFETKNSLTLQGDIGVARSTDQGATWHFLGISLDEEWHLSYPFVFEYKGQTYMMPEGSKKGDLRLYRATNFPLEWTLEKVLIKKPLVDASMVEYDGLFWIFGSDFTRFGVHKNGELEIWYANTPLGPWKQHKKNPVRDVPKHFGARNGGRLFVWEGRLYRPGQDCGGTYGKRLKIFQVEKLTAQVYREVEVPMGIEEPNWGKGRYAWNGVRHHHLDVQMLPSGDWIAVMDGDRVPSGDWTARISVGIIASFILILLTCLVGILFGFVRCIYPSSAYLNWSFGRSHAGYKAVSRLNNRNGGPLSRGKLRLRTCIAACLLVLIIAIGVLAVVVSVKCFLGGNGAEEPYQLADQFSQFTMVTMTYDARLWNLKMYVKHYSRCASVREILVVWNKGTPPDPLTEFDSAVPVRIRVEPVNSLNNRFRVDPLIKTKAVLELDDDIMMTCDDVERGFKAWREHPERLVGFYPRLIDGSPLEYRNERYARKGQGYNMILTGAAFIDNDKYFSLYSNEENKKGRAIVDELFNCEDILMNFILGNRTDLQGVGTRGAEYIHPSWAVDTSKLSSSAISRDTQSHYNKRTECLQKFSRLFNKVPLKKVKFNTRKDGWDY